MRTHGRPQLARDGQGSRPSRNQVLPALGHVTPLVDPRPPRAWDSINKRLRDMGDITTLCDPTVLKNARHPVRGRPYRAVVLELALWLRAAYQLPFRQLEGRLREMCVLLGVDPDCAPDHSTIWRHVTDTRLPDLPAPKPGQRVVLVVDSTGVRCSEARGWLQDRPYAGDTRKTRYLKLHLAIDAATGLLCGYDITKAYGAHTGDASLGPELISQAGDWALAAGAHLGGGIGDGAYDSGKCYQRMRARGGTWLAPLPAHPQTGLHPDRDRHIVGVKRIGELYMKRIRYNQRSTVEATNGALKRTVKLASRCRSFERQAYDIAWQLVFYATHYELAVR